MEIGYIVRFYDVGMHVNHKHSKEVNEFFHARFFRIPIFPFAGMVFDLKSFVEHEGSSDLREMLDRWGQVGYIVFCKNHIDILLSEIQDSLPFDDELDYRTFPPHNQTT